MQADPLLLSRIQFGFTVGFHFIFPMITLGLVWLVVFYEWRGWRQGDETYAALGRFFGKLLGLTFVIGVATGITMEFQFGTNWAQYSKYVGDIFGVPLAIEALFFFFLESTFLSIYLFGRGRVSKASHWTSILLVALGSTGSAFWILVANSWQQTPRGFIVNAATGRAELSNLQEAVFTPTVFIRFGHVVDAGLISGAFLVAGICAYWLLRNSEDACARKGMKTAVILGLVASILELMPLGHTHAIQVAKYQPEKLAAFEGLFETGPNAPLIVAGIPTEEGVIGAIRLPGMLSMLVGMKTSTVVRGLNDFPPEDRPPLVLPFLGFHIMVGLGSLFIGLMAYAAFQLWRGKLWTDKWLQLGLLFTIPLPIIACEAGWIVTEVGRQPWVVYHLLRTKDAYSFTVPGEHIMLSLLMFGAIYALLLLLYIFLMVKEVRRGPAQAHGRGN